MSAGRRRGACIPACVIRRALLVVSLLGTAACAAEAGDDVPDHHDHEDDGEIASTSSALSAADPVSSAVTASCSTTSVKGLATQLVEEIQCLRPGTMKKIAGTPGLSLGPAVFPYLQTPAANALVAAQKARGATLSINSGLRTLPQQYLLYRWYQTGRCGIGLAAKPGTSNHESAVAVDVADNAAWRTTMQARGFRWLGASDPVHFDYTGGGAVDLRGLSVKAFQRLWNRNHPSDTIAEDGIYGPATESRLAKSPVGGFAKGALCNSSTKADAGASDEDAEAPADTAPAVPDATEPEPDDPPEQETNAAVIRVPSETEAADAEGGCAASPAPAKRGAPAAVLVLGTILARTRRRRRCPDCAPDRATGARSLARRV